VQASCAQVSPYPAGQRGSTPGIAQANGRVRLVYADGARVWSLLSTDDGCTWSMPTLLYDGSGLYVRYSNFSLRPDASGRWVLGYSAWTASGQVRVRGAHDTGAGWVNWPGLLADDARRSASGSSLLGPGCIVGGARWR
jgi:hypothetical protein